MKLKKWIAATGLALAAMGASATTLDALTGALTIKLTGQSTDDTTNFTYAGTNETTWSVGSISQISSTNGGTWYAGASDGSYLYYMLYGIADAYVATNADGTYSIYNTGATSSTVAGADGEIHLVIYRSTTQLTTLTNSYTASPADRTGYSTYSLFAGMEEYLDVVFDAGKSMDIAGTAYDESTATLVQSATATNLPADGKGSFLASVVGGTAAAQWNTNLETNGSDLDGKFTLGANSTCTTASTSCFAGLINDPIQAVKVNVPEPTSIALFGIALAGIAGLRRRRNV